MQRDLDTEIAHAQERLVELDRLRNDAAARLNELHRLRAPRAAGALANNGGERSPASKVRLFRDLFSGREDVFAVRWESRARGRAGYAPRCEHEWKPGVCGKPKVRCGACSNQAFVPLNDAELLAHLRGHQVVGIYPLLPNDTCRRPAIDLDGSSWQSDVGAIRQTCRSLDLEPAIERSRSGNGAHVWFFFAGVVAASDARRLGFTILTRTMASGAALSVESHAPTLPESGRAAQRRVRKPDRPAVAASGPQARQHRVPERRTGSSSRPVVVSRLSAEDRARSAR